MANQAKSNTSSPIIPVTSPMSTNSSATGIRTRAKAYPARDTQREVTQQRLQQLARRSSDAVTPKARVSKRDSLLPKAPPTVGRRESSQSSNVPNPFRRGGLQRTPIMTTVIPQIDTTTNPLTDEDTAEAFTRRRELQRTPVMTAASVNSNEIMKKEIQRNIDTTSPNIHEIMPTPFLGEKSEEEQSDDGMRTPMTPEQRSQYANEPKRGFRPFAALLEEIDEPKKDIFSDLKIQLQTLTKRVMDIEDREEAKCKIQEAHNQSLTVLTQNQQIFQAELKGLTRDVKEMKTVQESGIERIAKMVNDLSLQVAANREVKHEVATEETREQQIQTVIDLEVENTSEPRTSVVSESATMASGHQNSTSKFKPVKPEKFDGKVSRNGLEKWIHTIENYATAMGLTDKDIFHFAISSLKEQALDWWLAVDTSRKGQENEIKTFEEMKRCMRLQFTDHMTKEMAMPQLKRIQQRNSVMGYTNEFLRVRLNCPEIPEKLAVGFYVDGLNNDIKPHVILAEPETVDAAVHKAIKTELALKNRGYDKEYSERNKTKPYKNFNVSQKPQGKTQDARKRFNSTTRDNGKRGDQKKTITCYYCKKPGHKAEECRKKAWAEKKDQNKTKDEKNKRPFNNNNVDFVEDSADSDNIDDNSSDSEVFNVNCVAYDVWPEVNVQSAAYEASHEIPQELVVLMAHINGKKARILVDSGAGGNFISEEYAKIFRIRKSKLNSPVNIRYADKRRDVCNHIVRKARLTIGKYDKDVSFIVAPLAYDAILGKPWLTAENPDIDWKRNRVWVTKENTRIALPRYENAKNNKDPIFPVSAAEIETLAKQEGTRLFVVSLFQPQEKEPTIAERSGDVERTQKLLTEFADVFCEEHPGGLPEQKQAEHKIDLVDEAQPPCKQMHLMSKNELVELREQLDKYLEKGWIRTSDSPFGAPVLFALKKDGSKRLCIDYRALNKITKKSKYPLPRFEELQAMIGNANWFSKIDLANGYHQVPIAEEDCHKTAFRTRFGQYEWTVMLFGLTNAPATFQRLINNVLRPLQNKSAAGILDDILIFTKGSKEDHERDIREVAELLKVNKLYAKPKKCHFFQKSVEYWGHVISDKGWTTEKDKVMAIKNWPTPLPNVHAVRSFLGLCAYYRRYVENFAQIALPLYNLIRKDDEFNWNKECEEAMQILKDKLTNAPILKIADTDKPFVVTTDASKYAIGAVLQQYDEEGNLRPIAYESRKLKVNKISKQQDMGEVRYPTHEKEMLAIIHAAKVWRHLLLGNKVTFQTDHMPLKYLQEQQQLSDRQLRWMEFLQQYDFEITYKPGNTNVVADALSRRFDLGVICQTTDTFIRDLQDEYKRDEQTRKLLDECGGNANVFSQGHRVFKKDNELVINKDGKILTWIPKGAIKQVVNACHDEQGHPGTSRLSELIRRKFWWPQMAKDIKAKAKECPKCQECKHDNVKPQGLLQPLPPATGPWERIAMDLITELPRTNTGKDAILTVTDTFSKYIHVLPSTKTATAKELANLIFTFVIRVHGVPKAIVSDRDPRFLSEFWQQLWARLGTKLQMSTSFHPQTDGQSERSNKSTLQQIRSRIDLQQENWEEQLPIIELTLNNLPNETTGFSAFFVNFNRNPRIPPFGTETGTVTSVEQYLARKVNINHTVKENIIRAQQKMKEQADKGRRPCDIRVNNWVMLSTKNLRFRGPSKKVAPKYIGPFRVESITNGVTCKLQLPKELKIFNKFHASLLKLYHGSPPIQVQVHPGFLSNAPIEEEEVENILQHREDVIDGELRRFFLIKWKNADTTHSTWEPEAHLSNATKMLREYLKKQQAPTRKQAHKTNTQAEKRKKGDG